MRLSGMPVSVNLLGLQEASLRLSLLFLPNTHVRFWGKGESNMEHRNHERFSTRKNIGIEYPGGNTVAGTIRDVSVGGIFVELCTTDLPPHALVRLRLPTNGQEHGAFIRVVAAVTRRTHDGIGLLYCGSYGHIRKHISAWFECAEIELRSNSISRKCVGVAP